MTGEALQPASVPGAGVLTVACPNSHAFDRMGEGRLRMPFPVTRGEVFLASAAALVGGSGTRQAKVCNAYGLSWFSLAHSASPHTKRTWPPLTATSLLAPPHAALAKMAPQRAGGMLACH